MASSLDRQEIARFARDSDRWWDESGPFMPLHRLNPVRLRYIRDHACAHFNRSDKSLTPLTGLEILDIGCGGGLVCEPLARMGATVTGVDADEQAIEVARAHAEAQNLKIDYVIGTAESLLHPSSSPPRRRGSGKPAKSALAIDLPDARLRGHDEKGNEGLQYDLVLALEIVEHVADVPGFIASCAALCRPGGLVILSTLNRTAKSFVLGIVAAEHIVRWVPRGTHDWKKFIRPSELAAHSRKAGLTPCGLTGYSFNPLTGLFALNESDVSVNYLMTARKEP